MEPLQCWYELYKQHYPSLILNCFCTLHIPYSERLFFTGNILTDRYHSCNSDVTNWHENQMTGHRAHPQFVRPLYHAACNSYCMGRAADTTDARPDVEFVQRVSFATC
jgi:hypothetical protein